MIPGTFNLAVDFTFEFSRQTAVAVRQVHTGATYAFRTARDGLTERVLRPISLRMADIYDLREDGMLKWTSCLDSALRLHKAATGSLRFASLSTAVGAHKTFLYFSKAVYSLSKTAVDLMDGRYWANEADRFIRTVNNSIKVTQIGLSVFEIADFSQKFNIVPQFVSTTVEKVCSVAIPGTNSTIGSLYPVNQAVNAPRKCKEFFVFAGCTLELVKIGYQALPARGNVNLANVGNAIAHPRWPLNYETTLKTINAAGKMTLVWFAPAYSETLQFALLGFVTQFASLEGYFVKRANARALAL